MKKLERQETRGRKALFDEPSERAAVILPRSILEKLIKLGDESGKGYGHFIREACIEKYGKKKRKTVAKKKKTKKKGK